MMPMDTYCNQNAADFEALAEVLTQLKESHTFGIEGLCGNKNAIAQGGAVW